VLIISVILGAAALFMATKYMGDLVKDIRIAGTPMVLSEASVTKASCDRYNYLVSACSIAFADPKAAGQAQQLDYLMFGSFAGERIVLLQPHSYPGIVTSNVGIDHIGNRAATLIGLLGTIALIVLGMLVRLMQSVPAIERAAGNASDSYDDAIERALQAHVQSGGAPPPKSASPPRAGGPAQGFGRRVR
jgi:hypothetical protein